MSKISLFLRRKLGPALLVTLFVAITAITSTVAAYKLSKASPESALPAQTSEQTSSSAARTHNISATALSEDFQEGVSSKDDPDDAIQPVTAANSAAASNQTSSASSTGNAISTTTIHRDNDENEAEDAETETRNLVFATQNNNSSWQSESENDD